MQHFKQHQGKQQEASPDHYTKALKSLTGKLISHHSQHNRNHRGNRSNHSGYNLGTA